MWLSLQYNCDYITRAKDQWLAMAIMQYVSFKNFSSQLSQSCRSKEFWYASLDFYSKMVGYYQTQFWV